MPASPPPRLVRSSVLVALAALLGACAARPPASAGARSSDVGDAGDAAARAAIAATSREFSARYERGDAAGMVALYTPDGVILPPGRPALRGPADLLAYWTLPPGERVVEHRVTPDSVVVAGAVAYDWGTYRIRTRAGAAAERESHGKYVIVWRETAPGAWRMHVDMWNGSPAPASAPGR